MLVAVGGPGGPGSSEHLPRRLPFKSSRSAVRLCGTAFLEFAKTAHLPTRVGLTPAGDTQRASQLTEGESERGKELKLQRAEFTWGNDANRAENVARVQIELQESGGFLSIFEQLLCFSSWYVASSFLGEQSGHIPNSCFVINPKYTQTATPFQCNLSIQKEF